MNGIRKIFARTGCAALLAALLFQPGSVLAQESAESLPAYYDLRLSVPSDRNSGRDPHKVLLNPIRNQGGYGTCWAHAAIASVESDMYLKMQQAGIPYDVDDNTVNLSEWYLAWVSRCSPIGLAQDSIAHIVSPVDVENYRKPLASKVYEGGFSMMFMEFMTANKASLAAEDSDADEQLLQRLRAPETYKPQVAQLKNLYSILQHDDIVPDDIPVIKEQIMKYGAVIVGLASRDMSQDMHEKNFFLPEKVKQDHAVNIVGWDDDYDFSQTDLPQKPLHKGAWIIRNSWGTQWADQGYCYISYEDKNLTGTSAVDADLDLGAVSSIDTNQRDFSFYMLYCTDELPSAWFADSEENEQSSFLKRVGFYAANDGLSYTIEVRTGSDTPEKGKLVYTQKGIFGQDGTPAWSGYRTIELQKYVFLPAGTHYTVSVRLENPGGKVNLFMAPQIGEKPKAYVNSYIRVGDEAEWHKTLSSETPLPDKPMPYGIAFGSVVQREYVKNAQEAMGQDFTVASLDDSLNPGRANIYLGRADELYGQNRLQPERRTLSTMTVDLAANQTYNGSIYGEGGVIKDGVGSLTLSGVQKYTGKTIVRKGGIYLASRANGGGAALAGDVETEQGSFFGGYGTVQGSISGSGTLMLTSEGTLQVGGTVAPELQLRVQNEENLKAGQVLLESKHELPAGFAGQKAGEHQLSLNSSHTQLIVK